MLPSPSLDRRAAVACALLAPLGLAACDIDPPRPADASGAPIPAPPQDSDLVGEAVTAIVEAEAVVTAVGDAFPALEVLLVPFTRAHAAHRALLSGAVPDASTSAAEPVEVPGRRPAALATVRRTERRLQRTLELSTVRASSGDLARVLASMAASLAQHLTVLETEAAR